MKTQMFVFLVCLSAFWFSAGGGVAAQGIEPLLPVLVTDGLHVWRDGDADVQAAQSANAVVGQPGLSFRYVQTIGETGRGYLDDTNHFYEVAGIHVSGATLWLVDSWGSRALKFDASGSFHQQIGFAGQIDGSGASFAYLTDIATDANGNVWVVSGAAAYVAKFDAPGNLIGELGKRGSAGPANDQFDQPIGIAFDGAGNIYVSDSGLWDDSGNHRVQVFDKDGNYVSTIGVTGVAGTDNGHLFRPRHIAVYGNELFVADAGNHRVQIFSIANPAAPAYLATLGVAGVSGADNNHFDFPEGVGADAGYLYVADSNNQRVQIFNRQTRAYVATLGSGEYGTGSYEFNHPTDVAVDIAGNLYVADQWNKRVQQYNSSLLYQRTYGTTGVSYGTDGSHYYNPRGVAVGPDGSLHIIEELGHRLAKLNAAGAPQWTVGEPGQNGQDNDHLFFARDVAVDGAGRVYVADAENNRVQVFNSDGSHARTQGGQWGSSNNQFKKPFGVGVDASSFLYVADADNQRVQMFDSAGGYVATLGQTGVAGSDNSHFDNPQDVAVDSNGLIYVADEGNDRVQVFNSSRQYVRTIGQTNTTGSAFDRFSDWGPYHLAVDAANRLYVADSGNQRVQIFDSSGAYLTTIGGSYGAFSGEFRGPFGLAVGQDGAVYVADRANNRIQKYAPGIPNWVQRNINGFGDRQNNVATLASFGEHLYAGTYRWQQQNGAQLWRMDAAGNWNAVLTDGFGETNNMGVSHLVEFQGRLYAGTWNDVIADASSGVGGQIWRSNDGATWEKVAGDGFGDSDNIEIFHLAVFNDELYAGSWRKGSAVQGAEIWRSGTGNAGDWTEVATNGFGNPNNIAILTLEEFDGHLFAGTRSISSDGADIWRYDGANWTAVITDGFGYSGAYSISTLKAFQDHLYAGTGVYDPATQSYTGGHIWRCLRQSGCDARDDWTAVTLDGFGTPENLNITGFQTFADHLYAATYNLQTGMEVWRTADGEDWQLVGRGGLGDSNAEGPYWDNSMTVFNNTLLVGVYDGASAGKVWQYLHNRLYLPTLQR